MRTVHKVMAGVAAVSVAATMTACSSSGSKSAKPVGQFKTLSGNSTTVALDSGFLAALTSLKLKPGLIGKATLTGADLSFPITGGNATIYKKGAVNPYVQGTIDHAGSGFTLTGGSTVVGLKDFVVHPGKNSNLTGEVDLNGKVFAKSAKLFDLDGSSLKTPSISGGIATLTGTRVLLSSDAAAALNKAFNVQAVKGGTFVGVATIKATGT